MGEGRTAEALTPQPDTVLRGRLLHSDGAQIIVALRPRDARPRAGGTDVAVGVLLKLPEIVAKHLNQAAGCLGEFIFIAPSLDGIEDMRLDARYFLGNGEAEMRIGAEIRFVK
jgi:hypothetical protein